MPDPKKVLSIISSKTELIDSIIEEIEKHVDKAQGELLRRVIDQFVDKLDKDENGNIKNTLANKNRLTLLDKVYQSFTKEVSVKLVENVVKGIDKLLTFNNKYYSVFDTKSDLGELFSDTKSQVGDWLGITNKGGLVVNGYLYRLINDPIIRNTIQNSTFTSIISKKGFFETKRDLSSYITGNQEQAGALQKYYRNFVYDMFSQVDRTQSKIIADRLKLTYAIYEGGIVKKTRPFCRARNGKVFTSDEIDEFNPTEARPPNYNPFTDLGGYGCRHHLNYVPYVVAKSLRPDLPPEK